MNVRMMSFCLLSLLVVFGCSPFGDNKNTRQSPESMDVDRGFHELETNFGKERSIPSCVAGNCSRR